jgi:hypothetical protein
MEASAGVGARRGMFFGYLFRSKKNTGWDCNRLTSSKQKGGTWGDDFSSLRCLLLHAQPGSHSREKVGRMKSEGLVAPLMPIALPKAS